MKKISVLSQLWVLSGFLLSIILILGIFSSWQATNLFQLLDHTAKSQVPAMRNMVMADMLHDGLRAVVMESYLASLKNDPNHLEQLVTESKEKSQEFHQYLNALKGLELSTPTVSAIEMSKPALVEYTNISQAIPLLLLSGKKNEAEIQKEKFNQSFAKLEEELEKLGELIEKEANQKSTSGSQILSIIIGITSLGIILGSLFAYGVLRSLKNRINGFLVTVLDNSTHMSTANENLQLTNKDLSASVSDSSSSLQETVASLDEVTSMIIKNSENAQRASEISLKTRSAAEAGETKINELQTAMSEISSSSKKMVEIINVIDEIAFQTNLLALNAAVEAARAGEQGRGFAVVADAVRTLAQRSAEAARSINQMIDESVNKINLGSGIVESFKSELNSIFSSVKSVSELNHEIAQASNEQRVGIEQISQAMNEIEQITQRNSANTNQLASVIEVVGDELRNLNLNISDLKNQFVNSGKIEKKDHSVQAHVIKFPIREVDSFFKVSGLEGIQNKAQIKKIGEF